MNISSKGSRTIGFLRRNLKISSKATKDLAYKALVRPTLEYASAVWDPYEKEDIQRLEAVQRRAARFVTGRYHNRSSVSAMLEDLGWPSLHQRRYEARLTMLFKIQNSLVFSSFVLLPQSRCSRFHHDQALQTIGARTNPRKFSFLPRTIRDWNTLPQDVISADSVEEFKSSLRIQATN